MTRGETPKIKAIKEIITAQGRPVAFNTALYDDGVTDTFIGDTYCSPSSCWADPEKAEGIHFAIAKVVDHSTQGRRLVPIFFKIQIPLTSASDQAASAQLLSQCQVLLAQVDFTQLSQRFQ